MPSYGDWTYSNSVVPRSAIHVSLDARAFAVEAEKWRLAHGIRLSRARMARRRRDWDAADAELVEAAALVVHDPGDPAWLAEPDAVSQGRSGSP